MKTSSFERINFRTKSFIGAIVLTLISSCLPENNSSSSDGARRSGFNNSKSSVDPGYGRLLDDNPIILSRNSNLSPEVNLNNLLKREPEFLVLNQHLNKDCRPTPFAPQIDRCIRVKQDRNSSQTTNESARWAYSTRDDRFLEVNTFGHMKRIVEEYFSVIENQYNMTWGQLGQPPYSTSMPENIFSSKAFWREDSTLWGHANDSVLDNATFNPSNFSIQLGQDSQFETVRWAQDPTIIYHEIGHAFNNILVNQRNVADPTIQIKSQLGNLFYDEGNSIEEGLADFASYFMNGRTHIGEWAMGRFNRASRPMSESEGIHSAGIDTSFSGRLAYPTYVTYDPNHPTDPLEDVHYAGQIISHYLVSLTEDLQKYCHFSNKKARRKTFLITMEALAELGDLGAKGHDNNPEGHINHSREHSHEWLTKNNPINFRSFSQSMARKVKQVVIDNSTCEYTTDHHEKLLDSYGLLLFKSYNESGNHAQHGHNGDDTFVSSINRIKTVLIPKDLIKLNPGTEGSSSQAFIFDNRADILRALEGLTGSGQVNPNDITTQIPSDLPYNNGNNRISPGEIIGFVPNLYNDSNTQMGGIHVLANDWDHFKWSDTNSPKPYKEGRPCNHFNGSPSFSQGGADTSSETGENPGECLYTSRENGDEDKEQLAPICLVRVGDDNTTKWAGQNELRENIQMEENKCLGGVGNPNDCFVRAIPGADHAFFSHIEPKKTWAETSARDSGSPRFNFNHLIFMEISPDIPPGTTFKCRFRVRFTNCDDCFHDDEAQGKDYLDYEYSGSRPFQVVDFKFSVSD